MPPRNPLTFNFYLCWKRILATRVQFFFIAGFLVFLSLFWWQAGFFYARRFFFYLFPYIFLLFTPDIFREEIDSGCLENVIFLRLDFRHYLLQKNISLSLLAAATAGLIFLIFLIASLIRGEFEANSFLPFLTGLLAGLYYMALTGLLGLRLRSGSNVLAVILFQIFLLLGIFVSSTSIGSGRDLIDLLLSANPANSKERLILLLFVALWPNVLASRKYTSLIFIAEVIILLLFILGLQSWRISRLELARQ